MICRWLWFFFNLSISFSLQLIYKIKWTNQIGIYDYISNINFNLAPGSNGSLYLNLFKLITFYYIYVIRLPDFELAKEWYQHEVPVLLLSPFLRGKYHSLLKNHHTEDEGTYPQSKFLYLCIDCFINLFTIGIQEKLTSIHHVSS